LYLLVYTEELIMNIGISVPLPAYPEQEIAEELERIADAVIH